MAMYLCAPHEFLQKRVRHVWQSHNLVILTIEEANLSRVPAAWSAFRALFSLSWRSTCAKDHGLFYLNYPQISEVGNPTTCAFICRSPSPRFHATIRHQSHALNPFSFLFPSSSPSWAYSFILIGTSSLLEFVLCIIKCTDQSLFGVSGSRGPGAFYGRVKSSGSLQQWIELHRLERSVH